MTAVCSFRPSPAIARRGERRVKQPGIVWVAPSPDQLPLAVADVPVFGPPGAGVPPLNRETHP